MCEAVLRKFSDCVIFAATPSLVSFPYRAGRGTMAEHDLTEREDRFVGLCLAAAAIVFVFIFIVSYS
jgi:hypothetical protein